MAGPLDRKLSAVLGERSAKPLAKTLDLRTVGDLLAHYPRRYVKRGELSRLDALPIDTDVTIVAEVLRSTSRGLRARRGSMQEVLISDGTGTLSLVFFNQPFITEDKYPNALVPGRRGLFSGKVKLYKGMRQLAHPQHQMFTEEGQEPPDPEQDPEG